MEAQVCEEICCLLQEYKGRRVHAGELPAVVRGLLRQLRETTTEPHRLTTGIEDMLKGYGKAVE
jgi:hypothetical protein